MPVRLVRVCLCTLFCGHDVSLGQSHVSCLGEPVLANRPQSNAPACLAWSAVAVFVLKPRRPLNPRTVNLHRPPPRSFLPQVVHFGGGEVRRPVREDGGQGAVRRDQGERQARLQGQLHAQVIRCTDGRLHNIPYTLHFFFNTRLLRGTNALGAEPWCLNHRP